MQTCLIILRVLRAVVVKKPPRPLRLCERRLLVILFALLCALSWQSNSIASAQDSSAPKIPEPARFEPEIAAFEKWDHQNAAPRDPILFVGSSTIRLWQTADAFPGLPVINRGFGGSTIADVNHYADRIVFKYKPRLIVFYSGDNDIAAGTSPQQVYDDFLQFVSLVRDRLPKTPIYFLSIKPSVARQKMWPEMKQANSLVRNLAGINSQVIFIDVATPMLGPKLQGREALPKKDLFRDDGLHMNEKGYADWNKLLAPLLTPSPSGRGLR